MLVDNRDYSDCPDLYHAQLDYAYLVMEVCLDEEMAPLTMRELGDELRGFEYGWRFAYGDRTIF
jgi:hypothetical protein